MKMTINLALLLMIISILCCDNSTEPETRGKCEATVKMRLDFAKEGVGFYMNATNNGTQTIVNVQVPFKIYYTDGTTETRKAYYGAVSILPGDSYERYALVSPASQYPYFNPRYVLTDKTVDKVEYEAPIIWCN